MEACTAFLRQAALIQAMPLPSLLGVFARPANHACPHGCSLPCRDVADAAPRLARFLARLQAPRPGDMEALALAAAAASAVMSCLQHASAQPAIFGDPSHPLQPCCGDRLTLTPAEAAAACGWATALTSEAARLLLAAAPLERGSIAGLLPALARCCHAASQLMHYLHSAADLPHAAVVLDGPACPELHGRFAHAALQAALAVHPHAGTRVNWLRV